MSDDLLATPATPELLEELGIHPDALGVTGYAWQRQMEPEAELHRWKAKKGAIETCYECGHEYRNPTVCARCGCTHKEHARRQRRARKELARRKGKVEKVCPICGGSGQYTDPLGVNPFRDCTRCRGWGRVWRKRSERKKR